MNEPEKPAKSEIDEEKPVADSAGGKKTETGETKVESKSDSIESEASKPNRLRLIVPAILLLAVGGVLVWYFFLRQPAAPANVIAVSGRIESDDAAVAVKTSGKVREITVREGDAVKAGQTIAVLDDAQLKAREEQAQAAVTQAEARITRAEQQISILQEQLEQSNLTVDQSRLDAQGRVSQAEGQVAQAQSQISQAEAQLAQAELNLKQARYDEEKFTRLFRTGDVSERQMKQAQTTADAQAKVVQAQRKQIDNARAAFRAAQGALKTARAGLANPGIRASQSAAVQKQINQANTDIDSANADADRARAQLAEAQANRGDLTVVAPFDGIVATRAVEPGEVVSSGTTIITLINPNQIYLRAFVPEGEIGRVKVGEAARVYLDSNPNQPIEAEVSRVDPESTFTPENTYFQNERVKQVVGVKLLIKNPSGAAKPGMPADGEILTGGGEWSSDKRQTSKK